MLTAFASAEDYLPHDLDAHCAILDIALPGISGLEVNERMKAFVLRPFKEAVRRCEAFDREPIGSQQHPERVDHQWVVVDDEHTQVLSGDHCTPLSQGAGPARYDSATSTVPDRERHGSR